MFCGAGQLGFLISGFICSEGFINYNYLPKAIGKHTGTKSLA
jgi:hypothetical protein